MKKMNISARLRNPWFWVGLAGVVISAMGADPAMFTSWQVVIDSFKELIGNPYQLAAVFVAVLGVFIDPTTAGLGDSTKALTSHKGK